MTDAELIELLRSKQICTGFKPDGHGDVNIVYGPDPVTTEAADRIEQLTAKLAKAEGGMREIAAECGCSIARATLAVLKGETP